MGKARNKGRRTAPQNQTNAGDQAAAERPVSYERPAKVGPGQVLRVEKFGDGSASDKKRLKNVNEHPLSMAFHRGQLASKYPPDVPMREQITAEERLEAGNHYRQAWEQVHRSGRDSLDFTARGGAGGGADWKQVARDWLEKVEAKMHRRDVLVVRAFCGEGETMIDSLRAARIIVHPDGTAYRVREALDDLVAATTGRRMIPTPQNVA